jgi:hypothetical protein
MGDGALKKGVSRLSEAASTCLEAFCSVYDEELEVERSRESLLEHFPDRATDAAAPRKRRRTPPESGPAPGPASAAER